MSPAPWTRTDGFEGWARSFLHGTWLGRKIVTGFWKVLGDDVIALNKLHDHPETKKLLPWRGAFEVSNCLSIHNYPTSFFDLVREGRIKVEIDEVQSLEAGQEVVLKSGGKIEVDAIVCATGWEVSSTLQFKPDGLEKELGLPSVRTSQRLTIQHRLKSSTQGRSVRPRLTHSPRPHHLLNRNPISSTPLSPLSSPPTPRSSAILPGQTTPSLLSARPNLRTKSNNPIASTASLSHPRSSPRAPSPSPARSTASAHFPAHIFNRCGYARISLLRSQHPLQRRKKWRRQRIGTRSTAC